MVGDVLVQHVGSFLLLDCMPLEDETNPLSRNVGNQPQKYARKKQIKTGLKYFLYFILSNHIAKQSNIYPITCHEGPNREWRYISTLSLTSLLEECGWLSATFRPLYPRE